MLKKIFALMVVINILLICKNISAAESPQWIKNLSEAKNSQQMIVVAGIGKTTAWISMHSKDLKGNWQQIMTTPGIIGKNGLGKQREGDNLTPIGTFHFNRAFGIKDNPGCAFDYVKIDKNMYWSGDYNYKYNQLVNIKDYPNLDTANSEHLIDYQIYYDYALNISYNENGVAGKGSGIFLHCFGPFKPYTGGCVAIPTDKMIFVMQNVRNDCVIVIDYLKNLSPQTYYDELKLE